MESQSTTPAPVTPVELLTRQLEDWQRLRTDLKNQYEQTPSDELTRQIAYCENKIDRLASELQALMNA